METEEYAPGGTDDEPLRETARDPFRWSAERLDGGRTNKTSIVVAERLLAGPNTFAHQYADHPARVKGEIVALVGKYQELESHVQPFAQQINTICSSDFRALLDSFVEILFGVSYRLMLANGAKLPRSFLEEDLNHYQEVAARVASLAEQTNLSPFERLLTIVSAVSHDTAKYAPHIEGGQLVPHEGGKHALHSLFHHEMTSAKVISMLGEEGGLTHVNDIAIPKEFFLAAAVIAVAHGTNEFPGHLARNKVLPRSFAPFYLSPPTALLDAGHVPSWLVHAGDMIAGQCGNDGNKFGVSYRKYFSKAPPAVLQDLRTYFKSDFSPLRSSMLYCIELRGRMARTPDLPKEIQDIIRSMSDTQCAMGQCFTDWVLGGCGGQHKGELDFLNDASKTPIDKVPVYNRLWDFASSDGIFHSDALRKSLEDFEKGYDHYLQVEKRKHEEIIRGSPVHPIDITAIETRMTDPHLPQEEWDDLSDALKIQYARDALVLMNAQLGNVS